MPEQPGPPMLRPRFTSRDAYRLVETCFRVGENIVVRQMHVAAKTLRSASMRVEQSLLGPWSAGRLVTGLAGDAADFALGLTSAGPAAIQEIAGWLAMPPDAALSEYHVPVSGAEPHELGMMIDIPNDTKRPFVPPARILDASQGWAIWFVPIQKAAEVLASAAAATGQEGVLAYFEPIECGRERAMVVLQGTDYRVSDFGRYQEITLALVVTPRGITVEPGAFLTYLAISADTAQVPMERLWGLHGTVAAALQATYGDDTVRFHVGRGHAAERTFRVSFPRFGNRRTFDGPQTIFSVRRSPVGKEKDMPQRTLLVRSGRGEGMQIGGSVALELGEPGQSPCLCDGQARCLCSDLRTLGVARLLPAANGWTERLSGRLMPPGPLGVQPFGNQLR